MPTKEKPSRGGTSSTNSQSSNTSSSSSRKNITDGKNSASMEILKISPNVKRYSDIKKPSNHSSNTFTSTVGSSGVVFNQVKARKCIEDYTPEDELEKWLLKHNEKNLVLCLEHPTHVSQRGGHYHIIFRTQNIYNEYLQAWEKSIHHEELSSSVPKMYIEELRTKHAFRLYIDIDIKLNIEEKYDIVENGWIDIIMNFTYHYFKNQQDLTDFTLILTQCHGKWEDSVTTTAKFKSGYRLYFHDIIVDYDKFCDFTHNLCYTLQGKYDHYNGQPHDWTFEDVIDLKTCNHPRCRLFGSAKWRRGELLPRIYEFYGAFKYNSTTNKAILDHPLTNNLRNNVCELLRLTSARVEDPFDE
ncbi:hypothetical protein C9374_005348 [Naegleria lovaniensis]|uniref:Uncharacterized protein n=1 Tax=Naegleria lovaniensis TaxID=51637 RepID=A0AA88KN36_NAELO|nr:uncharacterized protein C9374_005348 [Naegleria lovaniensis]KAG2382146.1 hypothetical protein C9374_005348 [Naegleria lovaniensis]